MWALTLIELVRFCRLMRDSMSSGPLERGDHSELEHRSRRIQLRLQQRRFAEAKVRFGFRVKNQESLA